MYEILERKDLTPSIHLLKIKAPRVAAKARAGQFVVLRQGENGERIPLTVADWNRDEGSVTVVFMEVGLTTRRLAQLKAGDCITDFAGPLGQPTHIETSAQSSAWRGASRWLLSCRCPRPQAGGKPRHNQYGRAHQRPAFSGKRKWGNGAMSL